MNVICPPVYGDPALLFNRFYVPRVEKRFKLGIIPHYVDKDCEFISEVRKDPAIKIIKVWHGRLDYYLRGDSKFLTLIDEICSCERILSSSLHGLILADAYGIPAHWIKLSGRVLGDGFKFFDHAGAVGRTNFAPFDLPRSATLNALLSNFKPYDVSVTTDALYSECPFLNINP
jgi:pyruvyltransferase